jgi:hypothetical protein
LLIESAALDLRIADAAQAGAELGVVQRIEKEKMPEATAMCCAPGESALLRVGSKCSPALS